MGFDKFSWIKLLAADPDPRLTPVTKYVLMFAAIQYVRHGGVFCVRQVTLADRAAVSDRSVKRAIAAGKECGYLELAKERRRGRSHIRADEYQLAVPASMRIDLDALIGDNVTPISDRNRGQERPKKVTGMTEIGDRADSLTSEIDSPKGITKGLEKGMNDAAS